MLSLRNAPQKGPTGCLFHKSHLNSALGKNLFFFQLQDYTQMEFKFKLTLQQVILWPTCIPKKSEESLETSQDIKLNKITFLAI